MRTVSWDIGTKNLAYCIMDYEKENESLPFKIQQWELINLLNEKKKICCHNDKKKCVRKASYEFMINNDEKYLCKIHKNNHDEMIKQHELIKFTQNNGKYKCDYSDNCKTNAKWCHNNNYYCTIHKKRLILIEEQKLKLKDIKRAKCNKINHMILRKNLINKLNSMKELLNVDYVIIENQPSFKNPTSKSIQDTLYTWFLIKGIIERDITNSTIKDIKLVAPSNKLKVNDNKSVEILSKAKSDRETYKLTKDLGIQYCKKLIENDPIWTNFIEDKQKSIYIEDRKVDDLCDSMLLGAQFITKLK
jgi:hypothetical protein